MAVILSTASLRPGDPTAVEEAVGAATYQTSFAAWLEIVLERAYNLVSRCGFV